MKHFEHPDALLSEAPVDLGTTGVTVLDQAVVDAFAAATRDHQWIHLDAERAAAGPFGRTIVHGHLMLSLASWAVEQVLRVDGSSMAINYGLDRVRFPRPLPVGEPFLVRVGLTSADVVDDWVHCGLDCSFESPSGGKPFCAATKLARFSRS